MESLIQTKIRLRYPPVAVIFSNSRPEKAVQFKKDKWGCVAAMMNSAIRGKTVLFDRGTCGCIGGKVGLCFGNAYLDFPGGIDYFLSTGREGFRVGEAYIKTVELARDKVDRMPIVDIPFEFVIFKPLPNVEIEREKPELVCFFANPDQISALFTLANYSRPGLDNVAVRFGAGCHQVCRLPYHESKQPHPRAILGMFDISARPRVPSDILSFTVPFTMFQEMERDVPGSFLEKEAWLKVLERIPER